MPKKTKSIPVNAMNDDSGTGIAIERISFKGLRTADNTPLNTSEEATRSHRHIAHSFFLLEAGTVSIEIDFQKYKIKAPSVMYVHPDQVHNTIVSENVTVTSWFLTNENLNPEYLAILEDITPAKPIRLTKDTFSIVSQAASLCIKFTERKDNKLYHSLLKDSTNALVALFISQYLERSGSSDTPSRYEAVTKAFRKALEQNYTTLKRPADYARNLNISIPYLNECLKHATGYSVSHHIQQRIILEAKRLLVHSDRSVKEIAAALGYDDHSYFSRLFIKLTGITALAFRSKNLG